MSGIWSSSRDENTPYIVGTKSIYAHLQPSGTGTTKPVTDTMPRCNHCNSHVSDRFVRVFADEFGEVRACPSCSANAGIAEVTKERARNA